MNANQIRIVNERTLHQSTSCPWTQVGLYRYLYGLIEFAQNRASEKYLRRAVKPKPGRKHTPKRK